MSVQTLSLELSPFCPGCSTAWTPDDAVCSRCGLERGEAIALLIGACQAYNEARTAAAVGRFTEARRFLEDAIAGGLADHLAVRHLAAICDKALGAASVAQSTVDAYVAARLSAHRGEYDNALRHLAPVLRSEEIAPLPAVKLALLCVAGIEGQESAAETLRERMASLFPGDMDLGRWRFAPAAPIATVAPLSPTPTPAVHYLPRKRPQRSSRQARLPRPIRIVTPLASVPVPVSPTLPPDLRRWRGMTVAAGSAALAASAVAGIALAVALRTAASPARALPSVSASAIASPFPVAIQSSPAATESAPGGGEKRPQQATSSPLSPLLAREQDEARREADLRTAQRWFNDAVHALDSGDPRSALRLAEATHGLASDTYLGDEALLLAARAADKMGSRDASARWARIAREYPNSPYAALSRRRGSNGGRIVTP